MLRSHFALLGAIAASATLLGGCGAAKSIVNNNIPDVSDPLRLEGRSIRAIVSRAIVRPTRAAIDGQAVDTVAFEDSGSVSHSGDLTYANLSQGIRGDVVYVAFPSGFTPPAQFTVRALQLDATVSDGTNGSRSVTATNFNSDGPYTFVRNGSTPEGLPLYALSSGNITLGGPRLGRDDTRRLIQIITEGNDNSSSNNVAVTLYFTADDTELPEGTQIYFVFTGGRADVGI